LNQTLIIISLSSAEGTAKVCGFDLVDNFPAIKQNMIVSVNAMALYQFMISNSEMEKYPDKSWCQQSYSIMGPDGQKGPTGNRNQIFK
jgi:hypothetical protein